MPFTLKAEEHSQTDKSYYLRNIATNFMTFKLNFCSFVLRVFMHIFMDSFDAKIVSIENYLCEKIAVAILFGAVSTLYCGARNLHFCLHA